MVEAATGNIEVVGHGSPILAALHFRFNGRKKKALESVAMEMEAHAKCVDLVFASSDGFADLLATPRRGNPVSVINVFSENVWSVATILG